MDTLIEISIDKIPQKLVDRGRILLRSGTGQQHLKTTPVLRRALGVVQKDPRPTNALMSAHLGYGSTWPRPRKKTGATGPCGSVSPVCVSSILLVEATRSVCQHGVDLAGFRREIGACHDLAPVV